MTLLNQYKTYAFIGVIGLLVLLSAGLYVGLADARVAIAERDVTISDMEKQYHKSVAEHALKITNIERANVKIVQDKDDELRNLRIEHEKTITAINADYANRMLNMQTRIQKYAALAEGGSPELRNLANHAARLDRTLEEGRQLVEELRAGIKLRDNQLKVLGDLLKEERAIHTE